MNRVQATGSTGTAKTPMGSTTTRSKAIQRAASGHQLARDLAAETAWPDQNHGMTNGRYWPDALRVAAPRLLNPATVDLSWQDGTAACAGMDPDLWFPDVGSPDAGVTAKQVCQECPLLEPCREHGIRHERHGIWGGLSEQDRRQVRRSLGGARQIREEWTRKTGERTPIVHGTPAGYQRHRRSPERYGPPCDACRAAAGRAERQRVRQLRAIKGGTQ